MSAEWEALRFLILALQREGNRQFATLLKPLGLTPSQAEVLRVVDQYGPLHLRRLGDLLICEQGSPSRLVESLAGKGLLDKAPDPEDVRRSQIQLTEVGGEISRQVRKAEARFYRGLIAKAEGPPPATLGGLAEMLLPGTPAGLALCHRGYFPPEGPGTRSSPTDTRSAQTG